MPETILVQHHAPFVTITLNRPDVRNAMSQQMVVEIREAIEALNDNRAIRAIIITGAGKTFCAGGDLKEMQSSFAESDEQEHQRTAQLDAMLQAVQNAPQVVIAKINGAAMGGGFGLVCVSDVAVSADHVMFAMPEVRLGIVPAVISPYVINRIGLTHARRMMLIGDPCTPQQAVEYGLVHEICPADQLDERVQAILDQIQLASPHALAACKELIFHVMEREIAETTEYRTQLLNTLRRGESGQEGMRSFIEKRKPHWTEGEPS